jgi:acetolactate synthase-1/2/3 large subunit
MFPGLSSVDVNELTELPGAMHAALAHDGPSVVSVECSADEIPPFAPFISAPQQDSTKKEMNHHVAARA